MITDPLTLLTPQKIREGYDSRNKGTVSDFAITCLHDDELLKNLKMLWHHFYIAVEVYQMREVELDVEDYFSCKFCLDLYVRLVKEELDRNTTIDITLADNSLKTIDNNTSLMLFFNIALREASYLQTGGKKEIIKAIQDLRTYTLNFK